MNSNLYVAYLPAMIWLQKDEADRLRDDSRPVLFPKFDHRVAVAEKTYRQLAYDDLAIFAESKTQNPLHGYHSPTMYMESSAKTLDELFLPSEKKSHEDTKIHPHSASRPVQRHLNAFQKLPRTAKPITALPACLVAGHQPSSTFQTSAAKSKSLGQRTQDLGAPPRPPRETHISVTSQGGTSANPWTGRRRSLAQKFDPAQFAHIPSHYKLHRQADKQDLQSQNSLPTELAPLRVVSALRFSSILPDLATKSPTPDEIPQSSRPRPHPQKEKNKNAEQRKQDFGPFDTSANLTSSEQPKGQQPHSAKKFEPVQSAQIPSHHNFSKQITNRELQINKNLPPFIPNLRPVSSFRLSGIFPSAAENLDAVLHSPETRVHPHTKPPKIKATRADFSSLFDGSNDIAPSDRDTLPSQRAGLDATSNISSYGATHKGIRRRKGYSNLRLASTTHILPSLPVTSRLAFPDFSQH